LRFLRRRHFSAAIFAAFIRFSSIRRYCWYFRLFFFAIFRFRYFHCYAIIAISFLFTPRWFIIFAILLPRHAAVFRQLMPFRCFFRFSSRFHCFSIFIIDISLLSLLSLIFFFRLHYAARHAALAAIGWFSPLLRFRYFLSFAMPLISPLIRFSLSCHWLFIFISFDWRFRHSPPLLPPLILAPFQLICADIFASRFRHYFRHW